MLVQIAVQYHSKNEENNNYDNNDGNKSSSSNNDINRKNICCNNYDCSNFNENCHKKATQSTTWSSVYMY